MINIVTGAYWQHRNESREAASQRIATFLTELAAEHPSFSMWLRLGRSRKAALRHAVDLDVESISNEMKVNRRDLDQKPIPELGYSFATWNGTNASFFAIVGAHSPYVGNSSVLRIGDESDLDVPTCRRVLALMIRAFDPDNGVVTSDEYRTRHPATHLWESGWLTYRRGESIETHALER